MDYRQFTMGFTHGHTYIAPLAGKSLLNPFYALGIVMRAETTRKSGCLEIESSAAADGEIENSSEAIDFVRRGGSARNR
ncbi:hypothetical protein GCM10011339_38730 [Echinicola rosea]|uniref:Uncharacterized protein n=1 Tax=Echinicola rosea TaxID=1807691 RepID=A0ABQ1V9R3_9BACT|nr:hypothetical protein GCM10011339_38730 [Echinicola rosea]